MAETAEELRRRAKGLTKKLKAVTDLQARVDAGLDPNAQQVEKLATLVNFERLVVSVRGIEKWIRIEFGQVVGSGTEEALKRVSGFSGRALAGPFIRLGASAQRRRGV